MMSSFRLRGICLQASTCLASVVLYTLSHPAADEPNGVTIACPSRRLVNRSTSHHYCASGGMGYCANKLMSWVKLCPGTPASMGWNS